MTHPYAHSSDTRCMHSSPSHMHTFSIGLCVGGHMSCLQEKGYLILYRTGEYNEKDADSRAPTTVVPADTFG